jgi:ribosome-associated protein
VRRSDETPPLADQEAEHPSKTRRKAEMAALQDLGEALLGLSPARLNELDLPDRLADALAAARRITRHEARRRQVQYIGRLMREVDPGPIRARLAQWSAAPNAEKARLHAVERWRERLLSEPDALDRLCAERPDANRAQLAALLAAALAERAQGRPPRARRELYRTLNALLSREPRLP